jgi:uncharacterized protein
MAHTRFLPELSEKEMLELLDEERVGRLGLNDETQPYVVPTDFAYENGAIYIHSPREGKKSELARKNPHVCFEVDKYNADVTEYRSVIIRGDIEEVFDEQGRRDAMRALARKAAKTSGWHAHPGGKGEDRSPISIFRIGVREMTGVKSPSGGHP